MWVGWDEIKELPPRFIEFPFYFNLKFLLSVIITVIYLFLFNSLVYFLIMFSSIINF